MKQTSILEPITFHGQIGTTSKFRIDGDVEIKKLPDAYIEHLKSLAELIVRDTTEILLVRDKYNTNIK